MKKFICALLSLAMLALFAGCRDQKNIETDTTDASSGSVEAQVEEHVCGIAGLNCAANRFRIRIS